MYIITACFKWDWAGHVFSTSEELWTKGTPGPEDIAASMQPQDDILLKNKIVSVKKRLALFKWSLIVLMHYNSRILRRCREIGEK